jgi:hypothetical protein
MAADAGEPDAGPAMRDAGPPDAGPTRMCTDGPVTPEVFDCTTSEPSITFGDPITADPLTWTWVPFDDAFCMNGSATGIGVSLNPGSTRVMILLEGGGACFEPVSCAGVANPDGFDAAKFESYRGALGRGVFDRDDTTNPMADWSFVYVPYCTGDIHGGTNESGAGGRMHVGYRNMTAYLRRLVPTFAGASQVLLAGRSAGGLGTIVNYMQVQEAFDCVPVDVFDDAGPVLPDDILRACLQRTVRDAWNLDSIVPADCPQCTCADGGGLSWIFPYLAARYPERRFGLASATADLTFRMFYGYGLSPMCNFPQNMPGAQYESGLLGLREMLAPYDNFETFYVPGEQHTFSYESLSLASSSGTSLDTWVRQLVDGDPTWTDVGP